MKHIPGWIDNSGDGGMQFDYFPQAGWADPGVAATMQQMAGLIADAVDARLDAAGAPGWLQLILKMPDRLRGVLVAELRAGNFLSGVGSIDWPDHGSIVVNMRDRFTVARRAPPEGVMWRASDAPHFAREEVMQRQGAIAHLLIT